MTQQDDPQHRMFDEKLPGLDTGDGNDTGTDLETESTVPVQQRGRRLWVTPCHQDQKVAASGVNLQPPPWDNNQVYCSKNNDTVAHLCDLTEVADTNTPARKSTETFPAPTVDTEGLCPPQTVDTEDLTQSPHEVTEE